MSASKGFTSPSAKKAVPISDVTGLQVALDSKSATGHAHAWAEITGKPSTFTPTAHSHAVADVTGLQTALDAKAATSAIPVPATANPLANGTAAVGVATKYAREDHVHPTSALATTVTTSTRVLGTAFQPNANKPVLCSYSVKTQVTNPLIAGSSTAVVTLLSDANATPTTERCRAEAVSSVGVAVAIAITTANTAPLTYIVPAGHYVRLVASGSGTHVETLISQTEVVLG